MRRRVNRTYSSRVATVLGNPARFEYMARGWRRHPHRPRRVLPAPAPTTARGLEEIILGRRSTRDFGGGPLRLDQLSRLLGGSYGIVDRKPLDRTGRVQPLRPVPSGGALYPLEIYPLVVAGQDLEPGVYHYDVPGHGLELLRPRADVAAFLEEIGVPDNVRGFAAVFVLTAVFERTLFKYSDRGYRFVLLDAGHVAQNLCLLASACGLGAVCLGGFYDDEVNALVGADGVDESAVYMVAVGTPADE
ncbi:MAG: SagB/ThcOx family dehydrogenase [Vicinamibacteria bacterium]